MERISIYQFKILGSAVLLGTALFAAPTNVLLKAGRDGWMCFFLGFAVTIPYGLMVLSLMKDYPGLNFIEITEQVIGKWIGKGIGILYIIIGVYLGSLLTAQSGVLFGNSIMPLTPHWVFNIATVLLILFLALAGIEVLGRFTEVIFPIVALAIIIIMCFSLQLLEDGELFPILEHGIAPVLKGTIAIVPYVMEYIGFLLGALPFLPSDDKAYPKLKSGIVIISLVIGLGTTLFMIIYLMTFGYYDASRHAFAIVALAKSVELKNTLSGGESIIEVLKFGSIIIKSAAMILGSYWGLKTVFGLKSKGWLVLMAFLMAIISSRFERTIDLTREHTIIDLYVILPFVGLWVPVLWALAKWKRRKTA